MVLSTNLFNFDSFGKKFTAGAAQAAAQGVVNDANSKLVVNIFPRRLSKKNNFKPDYEKNNLFHRVFLPHEVLTSLAFFNDELCMIQKAETESPVFFVRITALEESNKVINDEDVNFIYLDDILFANMGLSSKKHDKLTLTSTTVRLLSNNFYSSYHLLGYPVAQSISITLLRQVQCNNIGPSIIKNYLETNPPFLAQEGLTLAFPLFELLSQQFTNQKNQNSSLFKTNKRPELHLPKSIKHFATGARNITLLCRILETQADPKDVHAESSSQSIAVYVPGKTEIKILDKSIATFLPRLNYELQMKSGIPDLLLPVVVKLLKNQDQCWPKIKAILRKSKEGTNACIPSDTIVFMSGPKGLGKSFQIEYAANALGFNFIHKNSKAIFSLTKFENIIEKASQARPAILYLRNSSSLQTVFTAYQRSQNVTNEQEATQMLLSIIQKQQKYYSSPFPLIVVFSSNLTDLKDPWIKALNDISAHSLRCEKFTKEMNLSLLSKLTKVPLSNIEAEEIENAIRGLGWKKALKLLLSLNIEQKDAKQIGKELEQFSKVNAMSATSLNIPNVTWNDVGGLKEAKHEITDMIMLPQIYPELFASKIRPRTGLLFYGPPGTGKTLLAKAIANECKMNFISVKGPELLNMYVGESEKNIRDIFDRARNNLPCIIFFDELDALVPNRGKGSDSNQVMDRMVAQFLTEIDGLGKKNGLFVIGATNRPDLLDPSLLTPGRFDKLVYLGISEEKDSRIKILQAQTRKFNLDKNVDLEQLEELVPKTFTGADFYALTSQSMLKAIKRKIAKVEAEYAEAKEKESELSFFDWSKRIENTDEVTIHVAHEDFVETLTEIKPSVSEQDLLKYKQMQRQFAN